MKLADKKCSDGGTVPPLKASRVKAVLLIRSVACPQVGFRRDS